MQTNDSNNDSDDVKFCREIKLEKIEKMEKKNIKSKRYFDKQNKELVIALQAIVDLTANNCDDMIKSKHQSLKKFWILKNNV